MAKESTQREARRCECNICHEHPRGRIAAKHREINRLLAISNERIRRLLAGFLAEQIGRGGVSALARVSGLDRKTIARGVDPGAGHRALRRQGPPPGAVQLLVPVLLVWVMTPAAGAALRSPSHDHPRD